MSQQRIKCIACEERVLEAVEVYKDGRRGWRCLPCFSNALTTKSSPIEEAFSIARDVAENPDAYPDQFVVVKPEWWTTIWEYFEATERLLDHLITTPEDESSVPDAVWRDHEGSFGKMRQIPRDCGRSLNSGVGASETESLYRDGENP